MMWQVQILHHSLIVLFLIRVKKVGKCISTFNEFIKVVIEICHEMCSLIQFVILNYNLSFFRRCCSFALRSSFSSSSSSSRKVQFIKVKPKVRTLVFMWVVTLHRPSTHFPTSSNSDSPVCPVSVCLCACVFEAKERSRSFMAGMEGWMEGWMGLVGSFAFEPRARFKNFLKWAAWRGKPRRRGSKKATFLPHWEESSSYFPYFVWFFRGSALPPLLAP